MHVVVVGGSVTAGQCAQGSDYGLRFFRWINETWPHQQHKFTNAAKSATTSALYALCAHEFIPKVSALCWMTNLPPYRTLRLQDADIVVLEFALNDNLGGRKEAMGPERMAYEQVSTSVAW